jgi:acetyl esterase/lipase
MDWQFVRASCAAILALAAPGRAWSQQAAAGDPVIAPSVVLAAPPRQPRVPLPGGAVQLPGIAYAQPAGFQPVLLDLYLPTAHTQPRTGLPLVIYIHGGAWLGGDQRKSGAFTDWPAVLGSIAARGYAVASLSYRLSGEARFPAPAIDVRTAIRWLKAHATDYGIDPTRVVLWGGSAGGHLAAVAATGCHLNAFDPPAPPTGSGAPPAGPDPLRGISPCVQGLVTWYGVFDLATIAAQASAAHLAGAGTHADPDSAEWRLLGCNPATCRNGEVALASPVAHIDRDTPPTLMIAGTVDRQVPHEQSEEMAKALTASGVRNRLLLYPGIDHSFIGATPAATRKASLDALAATLAFIDETVGAGR